MRLIAIIVWGCVAALVAKCLGFADDAPNVDHATISGRVIDERGEYLPGARIRVTRRDEGNPEWQVERILGEGTTGDDGRYLVRVPAGEEPVLVQVEATKPGFRSCDAIGRVGGAYTNVFSSAGAKAGASFVLRPET